MIYYIFIQIIIVSITYSFNIDIRLNNISNIKFRGIGAISGGGGTSKLLISYPDKQRNQILDFLFKPFFAAYLQILKVEIGGDAQSTSGTEASHMHSEFDLNFQRGYEWWIMKEARRRNPDVHVSALPWTFPGWLSSKSWWPYENVTRTARYITTWLNGALAEHSVRVDSVGIWNEKPYYIPYIKELRRQLDCDPELKRVRIVAADQTAFNEWEISKDLLKDKQLYSAVDIIGSHYPDGTVSKEAISSKKELWSSEDFSSFANDTGAGCIARSINHNYVYGGMSATIAWNLIASHYIGTAFDRKALMMANQPWSAHYEVSPPIWAIAHTTQFTGPGWSFLDLGTGAGKLPLGGTIVGYVDPTNSNFTLVIETMDTTMDKFCILPPNKPSKVFSQNATFTLPPEFASIRSLNVWLTSLDLKNSKRSVYFQKQQQIQVVHGRFTALLLPNCVVTLTTMTTGNHGETTPPGPAPFPNTYEDHFDESREFSEPAYFASQVGVFEVVNDDVSQEVGGEDVSQGEGEDNDNDNNKDNYNNYNNNKNKDNDNNNNNKNKHIDDYNNNNGIYNIENRDGINNNIVDNKKSRRRTEEEEEKRSSRGHVMRQTIVDAPTHWCPQPMSQTMALIGDYHWYDCEASVDIRIPRRVRTTDPQVKGHGSRDPRQPRSADSAYIALRVQGSGCTSFMSRGLFFLVDFTQQKWRINFDLAQTIPFAEGHHLLTRGYWYRLTIRLRKGNLVVAIDDQIVYKMADFAAITSNGFVAVGSGSLGVVDFDEFSMKNLQ